MRPRPLSRFAPQASQATMPLSHYATMPVVDYIEHLINDLEG
jgi:hypothetical protein